MHIAIGVAPVSAANADRAAWDGVESSSARSSLSASAAKYAANAEPISAKTSNYRLSSRLENKENENTFKEPPASPSQGEQQHRWGSQENVDSYSCSKRFSAVSMHKFAVDPRDSFTAQDQPQALGELAARQVSAPQASSGFYSSTNLSNISARSSSSSSFLTAGNPHMLAGPLGSRRNSLTNSMMLSKSSLNDSFILGSANNSRQDLAINPSTNGSNHSLVTTKPLQIRKKRMSQPVSSTHDQDKHLPGTTQMLGGQSNSAANLGSRKSISDLKRSIRVRASFWGGSASNDDQGHSRQHSRSASIVTMKSKMSTDLISLPVPTEESRGKFRNKLRASPSLMALTTGLDGSTCVAPADASNRESLEELLAAVSYNQVVPLDMAVGQLGNLKKTAELWHQHVYEPENHAAINSSAGYILVPFGGYDQLAPSDILAALKLQRALGFLRSGFAVLEQSCISRGPLPPSLLGSEADSELQDPMQLYAVCSFSSFGSALPDFELRNYAEALNVFWQVAAALSSAERSIHFEHRDLAWQNIRVSRDHETNQLLVSVSGTLYSRAQLPGSARVIFTRLDHPRFYHADGDNTLFATYEAERRAVSTDSKRRSLHSGTAFGSGSIGQGSSAFEPKTNVIWLHYLALKLNTHHSLSRCGQSEEKRQLESLISTLTPNRHWFSRTGRDLRSAADVVAWGEKRGLVAE